MNVLTFLFVICPNFTTSNANYYNIVPSLNASCPQQPCLTLSQFATNTSQYDGNNSNIALFFQPGNHSLAVELSVADANNFSMIADVQDNGAAFVRCNGQSGRFSIRDSTFVWIKDLHFIGCGGNEVIQVTHFVIETATFLGGNLGGCNSSLVLHRVANASIVRSSFRLNSNTTYHGSGGAMYITDSSFSIVGSNFTNNWASYSGGAVYSYNSSFTITTSNFANNSASYGGVLYAYNSIFVIGEVIYSEQQSSFSISSSSFVENSATYHGGVILAYYGYSFNITDSYFTNNTASIGGAVVTYGNHDNIIASNRFVNNSASYGGVVFIYKSGLNLSTSIFDDNRVLLSTNNDNISDLNPTDQVTYSGKVIATVIGCKAKTCGLSSGVIASVYSSFTITNCSFTSNHAILGIVNALRSSFLIINSTYAHNYADIGGVISAFIASFNISSSLFSNNHAKVGGVAGAFESSFRINRSNFINNRADYDGGVLYVVSTHQDNTATIIADSTFSKNRAHYGGIMYITGTTIDVINSTFYQNYGSFYVFSSNVTFRGITRFENCTESPKNSSQVSRQEGGAITSYHSIVTFIGKSALLNNQARKGGAILAIDSKVIMWGETKIANNVATNGSGGGIYLIICDFVIRGSSSFFQNHASVSGGGIHVSGSSIVVHQRGDLKFTNNRAEYGGGTYLEISSRLVTFSKFPGLWSKEGENGLIMFTDNYADYGGAIYIADNNSVSCSFSIECFIQSVSFNKLLSDATNVSALSRLITFYGNTAIYGSNIFGGLFDRCTPSPFATVYTDDINLAQYYSGVSYLQTISNITLDSIASYPVRVCFCDSTDQPDCSYEMPTIRVKKGEAFRISVVAVDQVNCSTNASIRGILINDARGRMGEGQQLQMISNNCTRLTYNVFSPDLSEIISLFADGPCMASALSKRRVSIQFINCTCSVGFEPESSNSTKCECVCDSALSPYITKCDSVTSSILRANTNSWITYINDTDLPGFMIYPVCPFDYCYPPSESVNMNFNLASGSDAQCAHNRSSVLCGICQPNLSLSLGSSRCLPCPNIWPLVFISITLAALIAGILLVTVVLVLNMTVADGMINAIIFYANVTAPFDRIVHSSAAPSFPTVFVAWLNLDIGFDVCFFKGLDAYAKTWLQLLFPVYIISLVAMVIKISEYSPRFTRLISSKRRDPVATLATLILLSYAKLLSTTISVLSFATLNYPDGSKSVVWLVDGNVQYFQGKHIVLIIFAALIVLIGVPYTFLLFSWQWLIRIPKVKFNRWIKLNCIITAYHAPYNNKHRYWSGLLLLVRVVLYITVAVTVSNNPQIPLLMTIVLVGGLLFLKGIIGMRLYRRSSVDIMETIILLNLLLFATFSWYNFKADSRKETTIAYISTITVFLILMGEIVYSVILFIGCTCKRKKTSADIDRHALLLAPLVHPCSSSEMTHSSLEISLPTPSPSEHERNDFESETKSSLVKEIPIPSPTNMAGMTSIVK